MLLFAASETELVNPMHTFAGTNLYHGVFEWQPQTDGGARLVRSRSIPAEMPDPNGRPVRIATVEASARAICPRCAHLGEGGFVSFEADLRLAFACPQCRDFVWLSGA